MNSLTNSLTAIEFKGVSKKFGNFYANRQLNFSIKKGSIHGLIGENGAGKSTAMKVLFGVQPKDEGGGSRGAPGAVAPRDRQSLAQATLAPAGAARRRWRR